MDDRSVMHHNEIPRNGVRGRSVAPIRSAAAYLDDRRRIEKTESELELEADRLHSEVIRP